MGLFFHIFQPFFFRGCSLAGRLVYHDRQKWHPANTSLHSPVAVTYILFDFPLSDPENNFKKGLFFFFFAVPHENAEESQRPEEAPRKGCWEAAPPRAAAAAAMEFSEEALRKRLGKVRAPGWGGGARRLRRLRGSGKGKGKG